MLSTSSVSDELCRMMELAQQGFHCSDILVSMGLEAQKKVNPDAVRAVSALAGGIGSSGDICGALTGGACLLGLYAGRGTVEEQEDPRLSIMTSELMDWFTSEQNSRYGGIHCRDIIEEDPRNMPERCPRIVGAVYRKVRALLQDHGIDWKKPSEHLVSKQSVRGCQSGCPVPARL